MCALLLRIYRAIKIKQKQKLLKMFILDVILMVDMYKTLNILAYRKSSEMRSYRKCIRRNEIGTNLRRTLYHARLPVYQRKTYKFTIVQEAFI